MSVTLLLGDPTVPKGLRWELGSVSLPDVPEGTAPSPAYKTALVQPISNMLPNIAHIFVSHRGSSMGQRQQALSG